MYFSGLGLFGGCSEDCRTRGVDICVGFVHATAALFGEGGACISKTLNLFCSEFVTASSGV